MLNLTNAEADHLARHAETAAALLRELAGVHRSRQDAMHVIGEQLMEFYHQAKHGLCLSAAAELEKDAAALRERRKPAVPQPPADMPRVGHTRPRRPHAPLTDRQRRLAIEDANTPH